MVELAGNYIWAYHVRTWYLVGPKHFEKKVNIFIDCGTHFFQGFGRMAEKYAIDDKWKCYSFEANPYTYEQSKKMHAALLSEGYDIEHVNAAVYVSNSYINMNCVTDTDSGNISERSNLVLPDHESEILHRGAAAVKSQQVRTIDFSEFLRENVSESDFLLIKMDIEGSEFYVLPKLIDDGTYRMINDFYCEFHERFFSAPDVVNLKNRIMSTFVDAGMHVEEWD